MRNLSIATYPFSTPKAPFQFTLQELEELKPLCLLKSIRGTHETERAFANAMEHRTDLENIEHLATFELDSIPPQVRHEIPLQLLARGTSYSAHKIPFWGFKVVQALKTLRALNPGLDSSNVAPTLTNSFHKRYQYNAVSEFFGLSINTSTSDGFISIAVPVGLQDAVEYDHLEIKKTDEVMRLVTKIASGYRHLIRAMIVTHAHLYVSDDASTESTITVGCEVGKKVFTLAGGKLVHTPLALTQVIKPSHDSKYGADHSKYLALAEALMASDNPEIAESVKSHLYWIAARSELRPDPIVAHDPDDVETKVLEFVRTGNGVKVTDLVEDAQYQIVDHNGQMLATVGRLSTALDFVGSNQAMFG